MLANSTLGNSVHPGLCPTKCHTNFIIYVLLHGLQNIASSSATIPRRLFILRFGFKLCFVSSVSCDKDEEISFVKLYMTLFSKDYLPHFIQITKANTIKV